MYYNTDTKSAIVTLGLVVAAAVIAAFIVAWTQRLVMGKTYVAVTTGLTLVTTFIVISSRHFRQPK